MMRTLRAFQPWDPLSGRPLDDPLMLRRRRPHPARDQR
ncbi:hypothetical protein [Azospirillum palustre]